MDDVTSFLPIFHHPSSILPANAIHRGKQT